MLNFNEQYDLYVQELEAALVKYCDEFFCDDSVVGLAARYSLLSGGKRVRGVLSLAVCQMLSGNYKKAIPYACAVEMVHCYSLIHDDLPCMDNDDIRRGKPSCHKAYGETVALLAGDALLTTAFEVICENKELISDAVKILSNMAGARGMVYGQELDLRFENKIIDEICICKIHKHKTGCLINAAVQLGAIAAKAKENYRTLLCEYAYSLGLAFQIIDDVLDVTSSPEELGKPIGSDNENQKCTFTTIKGINSSIKAADELTQKACEIVKEFENPEFLLLFTDWLLNRTK